MEMKDYNFIQNQIGYEFRNRDLLRQAFIRRSYSHENGGENNEVLEFIGDRVLELAVVRILAEKYGYMEGDHEEYRKSGSHNEYVCMKTEFELTEIKRQLVKKQTLAERIDALGFADYLIMGKGDIQQNANEGSSVREDLFEAILGAVALDCGWDMETIINSVEIMLEPDSILEGYDGDNYVLLIQKWIADKKERIPMYEYEKAGYRITWYVPFIGESQDLKPDDPLQTETEYHCRLKLTDELPVFRGFGRTKAEARRNVCRMAYEYLEKNNLLTAIRNELDNPNRSDAISQLEILARRGYFSIPKYEFKEKYDKEGNRTWKCLCYIEEFKKFFSGEDLTKKEAKKTAAYELLKHVLK